MRLADGQFWNLPGPAAVVRNGEDEARYPELLRAICESDDEAGRGLAELALAIFLLNLNYDLSPVDLQDLLTFEPGSDALRDWRRELREIATAHVEFHRRIPASPAPAVLGSRGAGPLRLFSRWLSWLRTPSPARR